MPPHLVVVPRGVIADKRKYLTAIDLANPIHHVVEKVAIVSDRKHLRHECEEISRMKSVERQSWLCGKSKCAHTCWFECILSWFGQWSFVPERAELGISIQKKSALSDRKLLQYECEKVSLEELVERGRDGCRGMYSTLIDVIVSYSSSCRDHWVYHGTERSIRYILY